MAGATAYRYRSWSIRGWCNRLHTERLVEQATQTQRGWSEELVEQAIKTQTGWSEGLVEQAAHTYTARR